MVSKGKITIKEAAEILNVSVGTLRNWDASGKLRAYRDTNGYRLYSITKLEQFAKKVNLRRPSKSSIRFVL